jgi:hypothetical protein
VHGQPRHRRGCRAVDFVRECLKLEVTVAADYAGLDATAARLLQNQVDIGDAIKPFYGDAAGEQLTALLHDHITIAVEILQAAKAGDTDAFNDANARWYANANDIADFLSAANPKFWPRDMMRADMKTHLDQTLAEAAHELAGDPDGSPPAWPTTKTYTPTSSPWPTC